MAYLVFFLDETFNGIKLLVVLQSDVIIAIESLFIRYSRCRRGGRSQGLRGLAAPVASK